MFKFIKKLFRKKVGVMYNLVGAHIEDNHEDLFVKDTYKAVLKLRVFYSDMKVYVYKNERSKTNQLKDVVTYNPDGSATVSVKTDKSFSKIVICTEAKDNTPDYNLEILPDNYHIPYQGGTIELIAYAEDYNSKDNPEYFKITAKGEPIDKRYWNFENNKIYAILAPEDEKIDLSAEIWAEYRCHKTRTYIYQDRK